MNYKYPSLNMKEHRRCPKCDKLMVKRMSDEIDNVIEGKPAKEWVWWCNCGNKETGGILIGTPTLEWYLTEWRRANNIQ